MKNFFELTLAVRKRDKLNRYYRSDIALSGKKVFQYSTPPKVKTELPALSTADLEAKLLEICLRYNPKLSHGSFNRHIGKQSNYKSKSTMIEQLQQIYNFLTEQGEELKKDEVYTIVSKLTEDIMECSEGFHIRVNSILNGLKKISSLPQLLTCVREDLVQKVAVELNPDSEVHTANRVSYIANADGLGTSVNLTKDEYQGVLSNKFIRKVLKRRFREYFTPSQLPFLLSEALQGFLVEVGYVGAKEGSGGKTDESKTYNLEEVNTIIAFIKRCLSLSNDGEQSEITTEEWERYFIIDEDSSYILDLDWVKIRQYFLEVLEKQGYIKSKFRPKNLVDRICYTELFSETHALTAEDLTSLSYLLLSELDKKNYLYLSTQLSVIEQRFPAYYAELIKTKRFINFPRPLPQYLFLEAWRSNQRSYSPAKLLQALQCLLKSSDLGDDGVNYLLKLLINFRTDRGENLLSLAVNHRPAALVDSLAFIDKHCNFIDVQKLRLLFTEKDKFACNILQQVIEFKEPKAANAILFFVGKYKEIIGAEVIMNLLIEKDDMGVNVFQEAIESEQLETVNAILAFSITHREIFVPEQKKVVIDAVILNESNDSRLCLQALCDNNPELSEGLNALLKERLEAYLKDLHVQERKLKNFFKSRFFKNNSLRAKIAAAEKLASFSHFSECSENLTKDYPELKKGMLSKLFDCCMSVSSEEVREVFTPL